MKNNTEDKRSIVLNERKDSRIYIFSAIAAILIISAIVYLNVKPSGEESSGTVVQSDVQAASVTDNQVKYRKSLFDDGKARFFKIKDGDTNIRYFILKSSDGKIRAAFDACDVCWESGKGYRQDGDYMICNNCGRRFISTMINVVSGGCNPSPLTVKTTAGEVIIQTEDIKSGKKYFYGI